MQNNCPNCNVDRFQDFIDESRTYRGELKIHIENIHKTMAELNDKVKIQNGRIGKLENWRWFVLGCSAVIVILLQFVIKINK